MTYGRKKFYDVHHLIGILNLKSFQMVQFLIIGNLLVFCQSLIAQDKWYSNLHAQSFWRREETFASHMFLPFSIILLHTLY